MRDDMSQLELAVENADATRLTVLLLDGVWTQERAREINTPNPDDATLLVRASVRASRACATLLLKYRADPDTACGCYGETALQVCCARGAVDVAKALIEAGADINTSDVLGRTPLLLSCLKNWPACTALMLGAKAESECRLQSRSHATRSAHDASRALPGLTR